jgi:glycerol transport system ATP-binding protein
MTPPVEEAVSIPARVSVTELTGSESFVHLDIADHRRWVMLSPGIHNLQPDDTVRVFIDPRHIMVFGEDGRAVRAPVKQAA